MWGGIPIWKKTQREGRASLNLRFLKQTDEESESYHCQLSTLDVTLDIEKSNLYFVGLTIVM